MASVYERITNALSSLGKRRERDNEDGGRDSRATPGEKGRTPKRYRPWEQSDLHRRLETFRPLTWFGKPESVGPVPCALRGWINDAKDSLSCEHCSAKLIYPPNISYEQQQAAADLFSPNLASKHNFTCPWRSTACNTSLLAYIPPNNSEELCQMFQTLQGKLLKVDVLPDLDLIAIRALRDVAAPYGSYDDLVMGPGGGALTPVHKRTPAVRIKDVTDGPYGVPASSEPSFSDAVSMPAAAGCDNDTPTFILQPSKMTPQQKARLLALLGWDLDVLQPESASGSAALPYTQSAGYGLGHLGVKPKSALKGGSKGGAAAADGARYPMSSVILKCPHCNCRTGLWNFAGLRPVPTGRLTPSPYPTGASALLSPTNATAAAAGGAAATIAGADPLSVTIAGGQYGLHGTARTGSAASRPFGATSSAPFRFGSVSSTEPVFGIAALEAEAQRSKCGGSSSNPTPAVVGFGSPLGGGDGGGGTAASTPEPRRTGQKRKTGEPFTPEPMAVDLKAAAQTPGLSGGAASNLTDSKRPRLGSYTGGGGGGGTPLTGRGGQTPTGDVTQLPELDPVGQHRSWCPWIYTGTREEPHVSGWQHMLRALSNQLQQQQQQAASAAAAPTASTADGPSAAAVATPMDTTPAVQTAVPSAAAGTPGVDARQLKDTALAAIRKL
ncbi:hypothetical protein Vretimale_1847 [Volvox reticuliferus]|uniref:Uncharacterized protein n=1 Tax=Volvox reticuliferus TaxID=1737510 RepID=A0A8J4CV54_9CHLO|nr:hypothetical protein Vretifemale_17315 [Volvox reticuliferus]GIL95935.1 hypothetical protein Vretimale_1847 [Volvox reticuliferus]